mmetsp:Transcript_14507/g.40727  ORF Transcript_14507/g.40727 Transcript_14507/m.40727 type:complete len:230 (-) Transcript_14507:299-988(-)|eukprot:scaffold97192_cov26-Tisochrysis_lutea.AAC.3
MGCGGGSELGVSGDEAPDFLLASAGFGGLGAAAAGAAGAGAVAEGALVFADCAATRSSWTFALMDSVGRGHAAIVDNPRERSGVAGDAPPALMAGLAVAGAAASAVRERVAGGGLPDAGRAGASERPRVVTGAFTIVAASGGGAIGLPPPFLAERRAAAAARRSEASLSSRKRRPAASSAAFSSEAFPLRAGGFFGPPSPAKHNCRPRQIRAKNPEQTPATKTKQRSKN